MKQGIELLHLATSWLTEVLSLPMRIKMPQNTSIESLALFSSFV